jgi:hypothetical protein
MRISVEITGSMHEDDVEPRTLLSDFIRHQAGLHGFRVGCEHGVCGACTVQLDGDPIRSCLMLAVQAGGRSLRTVEGLAGGGDLHPLQARVPAEARAPARLLRHAGPNREAILDYPPLGWSRQDCLRNRPSARRATRESARPATPSSPRLRAGCDRARRL